MGPAAEPLSDPALHPMNPDPDRGEVQLRETSRGEWYRCSRGNTVIGQTYEPCSR